MKVLLMMSITGTIAAAAVMFLRAALGTKVSAKIRVFLWELVTARLLLPVFLSNAASNTSAAGTAQFAANAAGKVQPEVWSALAAVWAAGAGIWTAVTLIAYLRGYSDLKDALPADFLPNTIQTGKYGIYISDRVQTPIAVGFIKGRIILPKQSAEWDQKTLKCVIAHETAHLEKHDNLAILLMRAAVCIHWFNPILRPAFKMLSRDIEIACDERAVAKLGESKRGVYARTLVRLAETGCTPAYASGFGEKAIKERIKTIMTKKRITIIAVVAVALALSVCGISFAQEAPRTDRAKSTLTQVVAVSQIGEDGDEKLVADEDVAIFEVDEETGEVKQDGVVVGNVNDGDVNVNTEQGEVTIEIREMEEVSADTVELEDITELDAENVEIEQADEVATDEMPAESAEIER